MRFDSLWRMMVALCDLLLKINTRIKNIDARIKALDSRVQSIESRLEMGGGSDNANDIDMADEIQKIKESIEARL